MTSAVPEPNLTQLIADKGERAGGEYLVRTFASDVYGLCRAIVRDRTLAEDLAHDVFARALTSLGTYRGDASPRTWLLTIARHRCFDHLRAQKRERTLLFDEPEGVERHVGDEPLAIDRMTTQESLRTALEALDEGDRALVVLRHAHALGFAELAEVFGVREGAIRMRLSRATARMKAALDAASAPVSAPASIPRGGYVGAPPAMAPSSPPFGHAPPSAARAPSPASPSPFTPAPPPVFYASFVRDPVSDTLEARLGALVEAL